MRFISRFAFLLCCPLFTLQAPQAQEADPGRAMIVFDGSGSMWGQISGTPKIVTARDTLARVVGQLPPALEVGLIAYGHNRKGDCSDIETLVPVGPASTQSSKLVASVAALKPKGKTPLTEAVRRAARELQFQEDKATVILVTDGIETCEADPCAVANELEALGINFTTHVIGFGLNEEEGRQVACLAENTGGLYLQADNEGDLADALQQTVSLSPAPAPAPEPAPSLAKNIKATVSLEEGSPPLTDADGIRVYWSATPAGGGEEIRLTTRPDISERLEPGAYRLAARTDKGSSAVADITVTDSELTEVSLSLGAGKIDLYAVMANQDLGLSDTDFLWQVENTITGEQFTAYTQAMEAVVPSGQYKAKLIITRLEKMSPGSVELDVVTGETAQAEVIAQTSKVTLRAFNADGSELKAHDSRLNVFQGEKTENEAFVKMVLGGGALFLLPGQYSVRAEAWDGSKREPVFQSITVSPASEQTINVTFP